MQPIAVGADEAGAPLKEHLAQYLEERGYDIKDYGNGTEQDYPDVAADVAEAVSNGEHERALLVCGTGLGMAITANKIPGVPNRLLRREAGAGSGRPMGARVIAPAAAEKVLDHWLESEFQGGGSAPKVEKMDKIDERFRGQRSRST